VSGLNDSRSKRLSRTATLSWPLGLAHWAEYPALNTFALVQARARFCFGRRNFVLTLTGYSGITKGVC
jgi:hypothetical protein